MPRLLPDAPFPPYTYLPGRAPHPTRDPRGHLFGQAQPAVAAPDPLGWHHCRPYLRGIDLFNHGYYWEAHEAWESVWHACGRRGTTADFLRALIRLAAAGFKARQGGETGMRRHALAASALFDAVAHATRGDRFMGLDPAGLAASAAALCDTSAAGPQSAGEPVAPALPVVLRPGIGSRGTSTYASHREAPMKTVAQLLASKPDRTVFTIDAGGSVYDAILLMAEKNIGALLVTENGKTVGIVTERDYARKIVLAGRSSKDTPVRTIMSSPVMHVRSTNTTEECMALMTDSRFRHLPVLDDGELLGLVSIGDLVKDVISEQQFIIDQLQIYISGDRY